MFLIKILLATKNFLCKMHQRSKNEIIFAILDRVFDYEIGTILKRLDQTMPAIEQLKIMTDLLVDEFNKMMPLMPLLFDFFALGLRNRKVRNLMGSYLQKFIKLILPILEKGVKDGEFRAVNPMEATITIGAIIEGTILLWTYDPDGVELGAQIRAGMELLLQGLLVN